MYLYISDILVVAFAGDALICIFQDEEIPLNNLETFQKQPSSLKSIDCCFRALHCANMLRDVNFYDLSTHIGISVGEMKIAFVGGHNGSWTYLLNGPCISELSHCIEDAAPHHVVVTQDSYHHLKSLESLTDENYPEIQLSPIGTKGNYHFDCITGSKQISPQLNTIGRVAFINKIVQASASPSTKSPN
jgi:hypothetical protein